MMCSSSARAAAPVVWFVLILGLLAALTPLASCDRPGGARQEPAGRGEIQIEFWTLALRPFFDDYVKARLKEFEREHPGVRVKWVDVPFEAMDRKLIAAAAAGQAPDVINFSDKTFARFVALGAMADLRPLLPGDPDARYLAGALRLGKIGSGGAGVGGVGGERVGGALLALPWYLTTQTVLANRDLLAHGGLRPEDLGRDWAALIAQARPFHEKTGRFLFSTPLGAETDFPMMMLADGLPPFKQDGAGRLRADLTRPEIVAMVRAWTELYRDGALPREAVTGGSAHLSESYQNGRVAVINSGPNFFKRMRDVAPGVFAATQPLPPVTGSLGRAHIAVMVLCVSSRSRQPALAAQLAWHMTSEPAQEALCALVPVLPSTRASLDRGGLAIGDSAKAAGPGHTPQDGADPIALARSISARALRDAVAFTPALAAWPQMRRAFEDRIKPLLLNRGADVGATLGAIEAEWNRILDASGEADFGAIPTPGPAGGGGAN